jgi:hypothetical protein
VCKGLCDTRFCKPEVEQLRAIPRQHHIARFQIPMDDAVSMGGGESLGDLDGDPQRFIEWECGHLQSVR